MNYLLKRAQTDLEQEYNLPPVDYGEVAQNWFALGMGAWGGLRGYQPGNTLLTNPLVLYPLHTYTFLRTPGPYVAGFLMARLARALFR